MSLSGDMGANQSIGSMGSSIGPLASQQPHYATPNLGSAVSSSMHLTNSSHDSDVLGATSNYKTEHDMMNYYSVINSYQKSQSNTTISTRARIITNRLNCFISLCVFFYYFEYCAECIVWLKPHRRRFNQFIYRLRWWNAFGYGQHQWEYVHITFLSYSRKWFDNFKLGISLDGFFFLTFDELIR